MRSEPVLVGIAASLPRHELDPDVRGPRDVLWDVSLGLETLPPLPRGVARDEHVGLRPLGPRKLPTL